MSQLAILNTSLRNHENLFSLNDLHKASGGENKHQPSLFMSNKQTKELILELDNTSDQGISRSVKIVKGGRNPSLQGTWVCEELVLAYATWISPKFHLVVLRAFLNMHKNEQLQKMQQLALPEPPKMYQRELTEKEMQDFCWAWYALRNYIELTARLEKMLGGFGGDYARAIRQLNERYTNLPQEILPTLLLKKNLKRSPIRYSTLFTVRFLHVSISSPDLEIVGAFYYIFALLAQQGRAMTPPFVLEC